VVCPPLIGRRSDMVMALRARQRGYRLMVVPPLLHHHRRAPPHARDQHKLCADILGYATAESVAARQHNCDRFRQSLQHRIVRTRAILTHTGAMLNILRQVISSMHGTEAIEIGELINRLSRDTGRSECQLKTLDPERLTSSYRDWATIHQKHHQR